MTINQFSPLFMLTTSLITGCALDGTGDDIDQLPAPQVGHHCVSHVSSTSTTCFDSFTDAVAFATDGRIVDAPADAHEAMIDEAFKARINADAELRFDAAQTNSGSAMVAVQFENRDWSGSSWINTNDTSCQFGKPILFPVFPGWWNDRISSFIALANCAEQLYEHANYLGNLTPILTSEAYVGDYMNDRASTMKLFVH